MPCPVRCFSCTKVIEPTYRRYLGRLRAGEDSETILASLKLKICCLRMISAHVEHDDVHLEIWETDRAVLDKQVLETPGLKFRRAGESEPSSARSSRSARRTIPMDDD